MINLIIFLASFGVDSPTCQMFYLTEGIRCEDLPILASQYDYALCAHEWGQINCDDDPTHFATGPTSPQWYGRVAACPHDWTFYDYTTHITTPYGTVACVDRGGAISIQQRWVWDGPDYIYTWVILVDFLDDELQPWHWGLIREFDTFGAVNPLREG